MMIFTFNDAIHCVNETDRLIKIYDLEGTSCYIMVCKESCYCYDEVEETLVKWKGQCGNVTRL